MSRATLLHGWLDGLVSLAALPVARDSVATFSTKTHDSRFYARYKQLGPHVEPEGRSISDIIQCPAVRFR